MSTQLIRYDDFSKGDSGWTDKSKVVPGTFLGEQVTPYRDGSIGPRSGVLDLGLTVDLGGGGGGIQPLLLAGLGTVYDIGYVDLAAGGIEYLWVNAGINMWRVPIYDASGKVLTGQVLKVTAGSFSPGPPTNGLTDSVEKDPKITLITRNGDAAYKVDWTAGPDGTVTTLPGAPGGACIEIFNEFCVIARTPTNNNRVYFSAPGNFGSWPAANFFDVGASGIGNPSITAIRRLRDSLLIWTNLGQLFVVTGRLGSSEVVREFMPGDQMTGPSGPQSVLRTREGTAWWTRREEVPNLMEQSYDLPSAVPVAFTGGQRTEHLELGGYLRQANFPSNRVSNTLGLAGRSERSLVLLDQNTAASRALLSREYAWSRHRLPSLSSWRVCTGSRGDLFAMNAAGTTARAWQFELERPPLAFRGSAQEPLPYATTDNGGAYSPLPWLATPEFRTPDGRDINVERIEVLLTSHWTRDALTNHLDVFVQQYDALNASELIDPSHAPTDDDDVAGAMAVGGVTVGCTTSFDEVPHASLSRRRRVTFYVNGDALPAPAIRVLLQGMRGVSIHEVSVFGDVEPETRG